MNSYLRTIVIICIVSCTTLAQSSSIDRFAGTWEGQGKFFDLSSQLQLKWEWVLDQKFLRLTLKNETTSTDGRKQIFSGHAYYQASSTPNKFEAQWFDSRGITFPIKATFDGTTLESNWGSPEKEEGKSTYKLIDAETMEIIDSVKQKDGTWREFGRTVLKRTK